MRLCYVLIKNSKRLPIIKQRGAKTDSKFNSMEQNFITMQAVSTTRKF